MNPVISFIRKWRNLIYHVAVWAMLFGFPVLFSGADQPNWEVVMWKNWLPLLFSAVIFYINYFFLVTPYLIQKRYGRYLLLNVLLILLCLAGLHLLREATLPEEMLRKRQQYTKRFPWEIAIYLQSLSFILSAAASVAVRGTRYWIDSEAERQALTNSRLHAELQLLQYQLQPHFFFNALNNIYALIDRSPQQAKASVHGLAGLMRYMLHEARSGRVALEREIGFIRRFIGLMEIRLQDNTKVISSFPEETNGLEVAPLMFIPLVENAFKHGVSPTLPGEIHIEMRLEGRTCTLQTRNPHYPAPPISHESSGIGLANLRQRLELLYPGRHHFEQRVENGVVFTLLTLEL